MRIKALLPVFAVLFVPLCLLLYGAFEERTIDRTVTGITKDGELQIVYPYSEGGGLFEYALSQDGVVGKTADVSIGRADGKHDAMFAAVSQGNADIYIKWQEVPGSGENMFAVYHVNVDRGLNISYTAERLTEEQFPERGGER